MSSLYDNVEVVDHKNDLGHHFKTLYMIGDNPSVDINGAKQVCPFPLEIWFNT